MLCPNCTACLSDPLEMHDPDCECRQLAEAEEREEKLKTCIAELEKHNQKLEQTLADLIYGAEQAMENAPSWLSKEDFLHAFAEHCYETATKALHDDAPPSEAGEEK